MKPNCDTRKTHGLKSIRHFYPDLYMSFSVCNWGCLHSPGTFLENSSCMSGSTVYLGFRYIQVGHDFILRGELIVAISEYIMAASKSDNQQFYNPVCEPPA